MEFKNKNHNREQQVLNRKLDGFQIYDHQFAFDCFKSKEEAP